MSVVQCSAGADLELPDTIERTGFERLAPSAEEYDSFYQLPRHVHKDPFNRMLI